MVAGFDQIVLANDDLAVIECRLRHADERRPRTPTRLCPGVDVGRVFGVVDDDAIAGLQVDAERDEAHRLARVGHDGDVIGGGVDPPRGRLPELVERAGEVESDERVLVKVVEKRPHGIAHGPRHRADAGMIEVVAPPEHGKGFRVADEVIEGHGPTVEA